MPADFDFADTDAEVPETPKPTPVAAKLVATDNRPLAEEPEAEIELDETERKMLKLQYYWELLGIQLFETDDPIAIEIEEEVRAYIKARVNEMMGGGAPKKRGRKPAVPPAPAPVAPTAPVTTFQVKGRRTVSRAVEGRGGGRRNASRPLAKSIAKTAAPKPPPGTSLTGEQVVQQITAPDGQIKEKVYKKAVDTESQKVYYLGYDRNGAELVGDGNKYELGVNLNGGQYFRVISQQSLPPGMAHSRPQTFAEISAASEQHAQVTMASVRKNNLLFQAIELAKQG